MRGEQGLGRGAVHSLAFLLALPAILIRPGIAATSGIDGASAYRYTGKAVSFGPRPSGSPASRELRAWLKGELASLKCTVTEDPFKANTPNGTVTMVNVMARFAGASGKIIAVTGHYDTKKIPGSRFVGANDGGSSTGLLLELARVLSGQARKDDVVLVWFDGEEAVGHWTDTDSLYGSRHLAQKWRADRTLDRLKALINVDMVGDADLKLVRDEYSARTLLNLAVQSAQDLGYKGVFLESDGAIEDDHIPFAKFGANVLDLIDLDYGPGNSYWHNEKDTMDKLSPRSLKVVGDMVLEMIRRLERT